MLNPVQQAIASNDFHLLLKTKLLTSRLEISKTYVKGKKRENLASAISIVERLFQKLF